MTKIGMIQAAREARARGDHAGAEQCINTAEPTTVADTGGSVAHQSRIMRRPEVEHVTGMKCSTIYKAMADGSFPRPVRIGPNAVGWRSEDIEAWMTALPAAEVA